MSATASRFETSRFGATASYSAPAPRTLGRFVELTYRGIFGIRRTARAKDISFLESGPLGVLLIRGENKLPAGRRVISIVYHAIDDRFGEGTRGREVEHYFGEEGGRLPALWQGVNAPWALLDGSYKVGPEGIRN